MSDTEEENLPAPKTESVEDMRIYARIETADPTCIASINDSELMRRVKPYTESELPIRQKPLNEQLDPKFRKSTTEICEPSLVMP
jgi:hypothetical protein